MFGRKGDNSSHPYGKKNASQAHYFAGKGMHSSPMSDNSKANVLGVVRDEVSHKNLLEKVK